MHTSSTGLFWHAYLFNRARLACIPGGGHGDRSGVAHGGDGGDDALVCREREGVSWEREGGECCRVRWEGEIGARCHCRPTVFLEPLAATA